jgi:cytochrome P450
MMKPSPSVALPGADGFQLPRAGRVASSGLLPPRLAVDHWFFGHMKAFGQDKLAFMERCSELDAGIVEVKVYDAPVYLVDDPELVADVLVRNAKDFVKTRGLRSLERAFGQGLLTSNGTLWMRHQKLLRPFFAPARMVAHAGLIARHAERLVAKWNSEGVRDLHRDVTTFTLEVACETLFGIDAERVAPAVRLASEAVQRWFVHWERTFLPELDRWPLPSAFRFRRDIREVDRELYALIAERARGPRGDDLLSLMLSTRDAEGGLSDTEIRDELLTLLLAGHDTTATSITMALLELVRHPEVFAAVRAEVDTALTVGGGLAAIAPTLPRLSRVVKETLRLYPAAYQVGRAAACDTRVGPYAIGLGTEVIVPIWALHRSPRRFERPREFVPERWTADFERSLSKYAYIPFGSGPRVCMGQALASLELPIALATALSRIDFRAVEKAEPRVHARLTLIPDEHCTRFHTAARRR